MKKIASNRENGMKSRGPITPAGKNYSKRNALKHGLYSCELLVTKKERPELRALWLNLSYQLAPTTPLQNDAFERVVACCWRCKLALRVEARLLESLLGGQNCEALVESTDKENPGMRQWWGASPHSLREGIRYLSQLEKDIDEYGKVRDDWKDGLENGFGAGFFAELSRWTPMDDQAVMFANSVVAKEKMFNWPSVTETCEKVVVDPQQGKEMAIKLIRQERRHLEDIRRLSENNFLLAPGVQNNSGNFSPRYFTAASRDLHRAVEWFVYLKKNNL
jgi:hypothetical protein